MGPLLTRHYFSLAAMAIMGMALDVFAQPMVEGKVIDLDLRVDSFFDPDADGVVWSSGPIRRPGSKFLKLKLEKINDASRVDYRVRIVNEAQDELQAFARTEFNSVESRWTNVFPQGSVEVQVLANSPPVGLSFKLANLVYERRESKLLSISMPDDREYLFEVDNNPALLTAAEAVAKLSYIEGEKSKSCTGFLVDASHFITNEHCVNTSETCASATAIFGYVMDQSEKEHFGPSFGCLKVIASSEDLDVSILELAGEPGATELGFLEFASTEAGRRDDLAIIQHPGGEPKQVVRERCRVTTAEAGGNSSDTDFGHKCDTLSGSSGSPVLDLETMKIVGLHHLGFDLWGRWHDENRAVRSARVRTFVETALANSP